MAAKIFPGEITIKTLDSVLWRSKDFIDWGWNKNNDKRRIRLDLLRFERLNRKSLDFLGIKVSQSDCGVELTASQYVGNVPIYSPITGLSVGDLTITGRYGEDASELITLLEGTFDVEYNEDYPLFKRPTVGAPIFIECCKYIDAYIAARRYKWQKFDNILKTQRFPADSTMWAEYAERTARDPMSFDIFKNKCNILTTNHSEWHQLNYVLNLAIEEIESPQVSHRTKLAYQNKITDLRRDLNNSKMLKTDKIKVSMSDPHIIKELKSLAQKIIDHETHSKIAWRFNYTEFFERYVQYLFQKVANEKGYGVSFNKKFGVSGDRPAWSLRYLEPDIVMKKEDTLYIIDAKYKSHMLNICDKTEDLYDTFRHDFHQVLAYTSLYRECNNVHVMLVYPVSVNSSVIVKRQTLNNISHCPIHIHLVGVPMHREKVETTVKILVSEF